MPPPAHASAPGLGPPPAPVPPPNAPFAPHTADDLVTIDESIMEQLRGRGYGPVQPINGPADGVPQYRVPSCALRLLQDLPNSYDQSTRRRALSVDDVNEAQTRTVKKARRTQVQRLQDDANQIIGGPKTRSKRKAKEPTQ
ncbi:hypothetical protein C0991_000693, partial [Blastosporella zonata]